MTPEVRHRASERQSWAWESRGLVPNPTLPQVQGRGSWGLHNVTPSQGGPEFSTTSPTTGTSFLPPWQDGRAPILEGQWTTDIRGN